MLPKLEYGFIPQVEPTADDYRLCERLLGYFHACSKADPTRVDGRQDIWREWEGTFHRDFLDCLHRDDPRELARYLCNMASTNATHGLSQGLEFVSRLHQDAEARAAWASLFYDRIVCLAEMTAALPVEQPEQGRFGENVRYPVEDLARLIELKTGFPILPPQVEGGLFGLKLRGGILAQRDIFALEAAMRLAAICRFAGLSVVGEIGAGLGKAAFWARKMGLMDYWIFDLPHVSVISAFYLIKALSDDAVVLYGENRNETTGTIRIYPGWCLKEMASAQIGVIFNQDSMPEIDARIALDYLRTMKDIGARFFLSINQEGMGTSLPSLNPQGRVCDLVDQVGGLHRVYRSRSWTRQGYVEELYSLEG